MSISMLTQILIAEKVLTNCKDKWDNVAIWIEPCVDLAEMLQWSRAVLVDTRGQNR